MREVTQEEAAEMRRALKEIASYYSDAREHDRAWQAGKLARETLERLDLYLETEPPRD